jgi:hypothetical protein
MLVIISDLHLTDGTCGQTLPSGAFEIFAQRVQDLAVSASWRADGGYRPIDRIDVVLLGDVLDVIRSARWLTDPKVRPWKDPQDAAYLAQINQITSDILTHNEPSLAVLRALSGDRGVVVPPGTRAGRPDRASEGEPVPLRIHYMVGNHDWFYHLPGAKYDAIRQQVVRQMGLANRADRPFPHDMIESEELLQALRRHKVAARHGDLFDPFNFEGDRCASSLGDAIVIDLINRFSVNVESQLANELPAATTVGLREIDNIRPLVLIPVWIDGLLERTCPFPSMRKMFRGVWDRLVDDFLGIEFVHRHDTWSPVDMFDALSQMLRFSKRMSIGWASAICAWFNKLRGAPDGSYCPHALAEQDFRNRRARHIVYGHTHVAENVALDASYAEGYVLNQLYFNSGTWRRLHTQTRLAPSEHEFIASDVMTYLVFFQGDERSGRPYETWSGTLGYSPSEQTVHRVDSGRGPHGPSPSVATTRQPGHAPHFNPASAKSGSVSGRRL